METISQETRKKILENIMLLVTLHKSGALGGEIMPEDSNPNLAKDSIENYMYFTLPMALNYQRNSYTLWDSAKKTYLDKQSKTVFNAQSVINMSEDELRELLIKYKVAIQPNKQPTIWRTLCTTIYKQFDNDVRNLFITNNYSIEKIKLFILSHKKDFPYLSGSKILNYWLYVIEQYTDAKFIDRQFITVAPDTHVIQSSAKLGLINADEINLTNIRDIVSKRWCEILNGTNLSPIDVHTPMWLWSRGGFIVKVGDCDEKLFESGM